MKLDTNLHQDKPPSLEEGPLRYERNHEDSICNRSERSNKCSLCIQFMKVILYLELILFIGWLGCIFLTNYYWDPRYTERSYDLPESTHDQYLQDSSINLSSVPVDDAEWLIHADDGKKDEEQTKSLTDVSIEDKNDSIETEAPTTPSVVEIRDTDMEETMFLSKWLSTLQIPGKSDDWAESFRRESDAFWDRMMASIEDQKDKFVASSGEKITLNEDSDAESAIYDVVRKVKEFQDEIHQTDVDNLTLPPFWSDFSLGGDYADEMTDAEEAFFQDDRFTNLKFDFELPDLLERDLLLRMTRATDGTDNSDSSSSSEETKSPTPMTKLSAESSSSEEPKSSTPRTKRSAESPSSEETKNPAPKTKRSAESSSSESEMTNDNEKGDKSDSSDSSSDENDQKATKSSGTVENCPNIVDEDGKTIDDPKEIVDYIKRNWFNRLLETPVPDCDGPKSAKTITIDDCGKFVIKCTPADSNDNEAIDRIKAASTRDTRSIEENDVEWEQCERTLNSTREDFEKFTIQFVSGEASDPIIRRLRQDFQKAFAFLTLRLIIDQSLGQANRTDEQWQDSIQKIRQNIVNSIDAEHRLEFEESNPLNQEITNQLRHLIESTSSFYTNCGNTMARSKKIREVIEVLMILIDRKKCSKLRNTVTEKTLSLAAEIVPGETSDSTVVQLRQKFKSTIEASANMLASLETSPEHLTVHANATINKWRNYVHDFQEETGDPVISERIAAFGRPTKEQEDQVQEILEYYLRVHQQCKKITSSPIADELESMIHDWDQRLAGSSRSEPMEQPRDKRWVSADPIIETTVKMCWVDEVDAQLLTERQARLEAWANGSTFYEPLNHTVTALERQLNSTNPSAIPISNVAHEPSGLLMLANHLLTNATSELRKEGYELLRDLILEIQEMESQVGEWKDFNTSTFMENMTNCLYGSREEITSELIFGIVVTTGRAGNLRYTGIDDTEDCNKPYKPTYGEFIYVGEEPENVGIQQWRHILNGIIKLYFKILNPKVREGCNSSEPETTTIGTSAIAESKDIVKRSIGYPNRKYGDNSLYMADKGFSRNDDSGSLRRMNVASDPDQQNFDISEKMFFDKMELLSSHIDRLHELYMKFNELNDDYVSREFPIESPLNNEY